jgi:hypothetical protein
LSTGAPRTGEEVFFFRGVITGLLLTASLTAAGDFRSTVSAWRCTKHLSKGRPPGPEDHGGCSVGDYVRQLRVEDACRRLATLDAPIVEIALAAGFTDQSHFTRTFQRLRGLTPAEFRRRHRLC